MNFHDVQFPTAISRGATGGPERRTDIVVLGSGHEERNSRWADSKRRYDAGYGIKTLDELYTVLAFFEERRGALYGFRWKDPSDWKSCPPLARPTPTDQVIGVGDGKRATFHLIKQYGAATKLHHTLLLLVFSSQTHKQHKFGCVISFSWLLWHCHHIYLSFNNEDSCHNCSGGSDLGRSFNVAIFSKVSMMSISRLYFLLSLLIIKCLYDLFRKSYVFSVCFFLKDVHNVEHCAIL